MKVLLYFIILVLIISCETEDSNSIKDNSIKENSIKEQGLLEGYLNNNPKIIVQKTTYSQISYNKYYSTYRGYVFTPIQNIKIKAIGARIAGYGTFKIEIYRWPYKIDTLLIDSVTINNTSIFQYKNITRELILKPNEEYLIRCFNINHNFVFDAGLGYGNDTTNILNFPLLIKDVKILCPYYAYTSSYDGNFYTIIEGIWFGGILRGLVDFKYELTK